MNRFVLNGAALNGSIEKWIEETSASVVVQADGQLATGLALVGDAAVSFSATLEPSVWRPGQGTASVVFDGTGELTYGRTLIGDADIVLAADGDGTRWTFGEGAAPVEFIVDGDGQVVAPTSGIATIVFEATLDARVATVHQGEGRADVVFDCLLEPWTAKQGKIEGIAEIVLAAEGEGYRIMQSPPGYAEVRFDAAGDARLGGKVYLEGDAAFGIMARGSIGSLHYVYGEGEASIEFKAGAVSAGKAVIPDDYVPAPVARTITVQRAARSHSVAREIRSI